jgi:predicted nucleic acid-binding protein
VRSYLDTNVLVAASVEAHPHHVPAVEILKKIRARKIQGVVSTHLLAEMYAVLTRTPFIPRIHPVEAQRLIEVNALNACEVVALTAQQYREAIAEAATNGWGGGKVYDLLHVKAAVIAKCSRLYTFNTHEFRQLSGAFAKMITAP